MTVQQLIKKLDALVKQDPTASMKIVKLQQFNTNDSEVECTYVESELDDRITLI